MKRAKWGGEGDGGEEEKDGIERVTITQGGVGDVVDDGKNQWRGGERESVGAAAAVEKDDAGERG